MTLILLYLDKLDERSRQNPIEVPFWRHLIFAPDEAFRLQLEDIHAEALRDMNVEKASQKPDRLQQLSIDHPDSRLTESAMHEKLSVQHKQAITKQEGRIQNKGQFGI